MSTNVPVLKKSEQLRQNFKGNPVVSPLVDIFESKDEYLVIADMPGTSAETLSVRVDQGELLIEGYWACEEKGSVIAREFRPLDFRRTFIVPDGVDLAGISAKLADGVLSIRLPKVEAAKPRKIEIQVG